MSDIGLEAQEEVTLACNRKRKQKLAASAKERSKELLRGREPGNPARQSAENTNHKG